MILRTLVVAFAVLVGFGVTAGAQDGASTDKPLVLLAGATGKNGSYILKQLTEGADRPYRVRAMTRDVAKAKQKFGDIAEWVEADVTKPETLQGVFDGVTYIIDAKAAPLNPLGDSPEQVDLQGTQNMIAAAKAATKEGGGVKKYVIITSSVSGTKDHFLNKIGRDVLIYKALAEDALMASGIPYVIVGPSGMTDDPPGKEIVLIPRSEYKSGTKITRADTARVCIAALSNPDANNRVFSVHNGDGPYSDDWQNAFATLPAQ
ncbi:MAG: SDR family oxidoreductase [Rhodobacteraceae bacterium]|nr:SDR family oxidoreductase [Paracoccaceae bacterium]